MLSLLLHPTFFLIILSSPAPSFLSFIFYFFGSFVLFTSPLPPPNTFSFAVSFSLLSLQRDTHIFPIDTPSLFTHVPTAFNLHSHLTSRLASFLPYPISKPLHHTDNHFELLRRPPSFCLSVLGDVFLFCFTFSLPSLLSFSFLLFFVSFFIFRLTLNLFRPIPLVPLSLPSLALFGFSSLRPPSLHCLFLSLSLSRARSLSLSLCSLFSNPFSLGLFFSSFFLSSSFLSSSNRSV